jgi:ribosomal protein L31
MKSKSPTRKLSKSRKKASGRKRSGSKRSGSKRSGRKSSRRKRSGRSASRKSSRRKSSRRKRSKQTPARKRSKASRKSSRKSSRKQKNVNIDVIFYGQPYYNAVMKGDFTKINKHINEFNKLFKRKIGQSGPYGEHVIYSINPVETNKFKKKAREIFGKLKLHVSFNTSKSLKYLDKPSSR